MSNAVLPTWGGYHGYTTWLLWLHKYGYLYGCTSWKSKARGVVTFLVFPVVAELIHDVLVDLKKGHGSGKSDL